MSSFRGPLTPPIEPPDNDPEPRHPAAYESFVRFVELTARRRDLTRELKKVGQEIQMLEPMLRDYLGSEGFKRVTIDGFTIFLRNGLWGRSKEGVSAGAVCQALKESGLAHFVHERYYAKQLSSHLEGLQEAYQKELEEGTYESLADLLPAPLAAVLNVEPYQSVIALDKRGKNINES
jgi:hypothetical protein